ncbi:MAG: hypothetical protein OEV40_23445, partial [Acidimicrobiia bacterium]|nr:hypothetical protein [Acidimicrobiia bacterium]
MARLVGLGLLFWAVYASLTYSLEHVPRPASAAPSALDRPSPVDALAEASAEPEPAIRPAPAGPAWAPGAYVVGASADDEIAATDRDYRPRETVFSDDEELFDDEGVSDEGESEEGELFDDEGVSDEGLADDQAGAGDGVPVTPRSVVGEIAPGLYATAFDVEDCTYELWRVMRDRQPRVIAEEYLAAGRLLVSINGIEPDWFTATESCGSWYPWRPISAPLT